MSDGAAVGRLVELLWMGLALPWVAVALGSVSSPWLEVAPGSVSSPVVDFVLAAKALGAEALGAGTQVPSQEPDART